MAHPLPLGTKVYHVGQEWHRPEMGGTAQIIDVDGPYKDGSYEYTVMEGMEFGRRIGPDNPLIREGKWSSLVTKEAVREC